jgi:hypothetical protein
MRWRLGWRMLKWMDDGVKHDRGVLLCIAHPG